MAMTNAERQRAYRQRRASGAVPVRYKRAQDRRSRPQRWADAVAELQSLLNEYAEWRDSLPDNLSGGALAEKLDAVLELEGTIGDIAEIELPLGFGRD